MTMRELWDEAIMPALSCAAALALVAVWVL